MDLLPPEILLIIFKNVYETTTPHRQPSNEDRVQEKLDSCEIGTALFFPYTLSSVCKRWEQIMLLVPEFWSQVVVFVDSPVFRLSQLRAELHASRDREIERIIVTRQTETLLNSPHHEKERVDRITELVGQYAPRCKSIQYNVLYTSSLPLITTTFLQPCQNLETLSLTASIGNRPADAIFTPSLRELDQFPTLRHLDIDGWNFVDLCKRDPGWTQTVMRNSYPHLSITHFKETYECIHYHDALSVLAFLPVYFYTLHLGFLEFKIPLNWKPVHRGVIGRSWLADLTLDNIGSELTAWFLKRCRTLQSLTLKNCALDSIDASYIPNSYTLTLQDMRNSTEICTFISRWTGAVLVVQDCPGFNEEVLDVLGTVRRTNESGHPVFNAPELEELDVSGCDGFSAEALHELSRRRVQPWAKSLEVGLSVRFRAKLS